MIFLKNICRIIIIGFLILFLYEIFLSYGPYSKGVSPVIYDKTIGMWHKKKFSSKVKNDCYDNIFYFDKLGLVLNQNDHSKSKKNILIFGDSQIEALMVPNENIIHNRLDKLLNKNYNVYNFGLSGSTPMTNFMSIKYKTQDIIDSTDLIIQFINISYISDVNLNYSSIDRPKVDIRFKSLDEYYVVPIRKKTFIDYAMDKIGKYEIFSFITILLIKSTTILNKLLSYSVFANDGIFSKNNIVNSIGSIYQINLFLKEKNINYIPVLFNIGDNNNEFKNLKEFFLINQIDYIDLDKALIESKSELKYFSCNGHWNSYDHKVIAELVYKKIKMIKN